MVLNIALVAMQLQVQCKDFPRPPLENSGSFKEAAAMVKRIKGYPKPERPLKVVIAGGGKLAADSIVDEPEHPAEKRGGGGGVHSRSASHSVSHVISSRPRNVLERCSWQIWQASGQQHVQHLLPYHQSPHAELLHQSLSIVNSCNVGLARFLLEVHHCPLDVVSSSAPALVVH